MSDTKRAILFYTGLLGLLCLLWGGQRLELIQILGAGLLWLCFWDITADQTPDGDDDG